MTEPIASPDRLDAEGNVRCARCGLHKPACQFSVKRQRGKEYVYSYCLTCKCEMARKVSKTGRAGAGMKYCPDCGEMLPVSEFYQVRRTTRTYLTTYCKRHHNARRKRNREYDRDPDVSEGRRRYGAEPMGITPYATPRERYEWARL